MTEPKFSTEWFKLVPNADSSPTTGIKINLDGIHMYAKETTFRFTDNLSGTLKGQIYTAPTASLGKYKAKVMAYPSDKVSEIIDWSDVIDGEGDDVHDRLLTLEAKKEIETNDDGTYELSLPPGTYDILIDKPGYLDQIYTQIVVEAGAEVDLGYKELLAGDLNKDGIIEIVDVAVLMNIYGNNLGDADYDVKGDLNEDGAIEIVDKAVLMTNYSEIRKIEKGRE